MRLELGTFPVEDVAFGSRTRWRDGRLEINRDELSRAVLSDRRIQRVDLELVKPGESVRITAVRDVLEPRMKVKGPGMVYPGVRGRPVTPVGKGRTHRLAGIAVTEVAEVLMYNGNDGWLDTFIDMTGKGPESPINTIPNLCVVLTVDPALSIEDRNDAAHGAALVVSDRLAATTFDLEPPQLETFELTPADPSLPRVVYIICLRSPQHYSNSLYAFWTNIYGLSRLTPPWLLHPNELIDGAINVRTSWVLVNNPVLLELYRRHGREINFLGCIAIRTRWSSQPEKDTTSTQAAKLARMLGATGAVITYDAGGNDFMEVIRTVQACEQEGISTVFVTGEEDPSTGGPPLLEPLPEARAIVSIGIGRVGYERETLPPVQRVIGSSTIMRDPSQRQHLVPSDGPLPARGWPDHYGFGRVSCIDY